MLDEHAAASHQCFKGVAVSNDSPPPGTIESERCSSNKIDEVVKPSNCCRCPWSGAPYLAAARIYLQRCSSITIQVSRERLQGSR